MKAFQFHANVNVQVYEVLEKDCLMYVWPCSHVLAHYVWKCREQVDGKRVLELGAGVGYPGLLAKACGAKEVVLTDTRRNTNIQRANCTADVKWMELKWGRMVEDEFDIVLASDCFYNSEDFEDVIATMYSVLKMNSNAVIWTTYQLRSFNRSIGGLLEKWELTARNIPIEEFYPSEDCSEYDDKSTSIYLIEIK